MKKKMRIFKIKKKISENTRKKGREPLISGCACVHPREPLWGHVTSGQNTRKKGGNPNFRLRMRAPERIPFGVT